MVERYETAPSQHGDITCAFSKAKIQILNIDLFEMAIMA